MALNLQNSINSSIASQGGSNNLATKDNSSLISSVPVQRVSAPSAIPVAEVSAPTAPVPTISQPPVRSAVATNLPPVTENAPSAPDTGTDFGQAIVDLGNRDLTEDKQSIRDDAQLAAKEERTRRLGERIRERDVSYRDRLEALEENPEGKLTGALNGDINDLEVARSREMADLSFSYQVALGDFNAAQDVVDNRIADMEADITRRMKTYETAFSMAQNDLTDSEKIAVQQAFEKEQNEIKHKNDIELTAYKESLKASQFTMTPSDIAVAGGGIFDILAASAQFDDTLAATERQSLTKAVNVAGQLGSLADLVNLDGELYGPLVGQVRSINPFDTNAQQFKALIQGIVPNLARGIYGEVGVLTDTDIDNYAKTLPTLSSTEEVQDAMLGLTLKLVRDSVQNQLSVAAQNSVNVSGNVALLDQLDTLVGTALTPINMRSPQAQALIEAGAPKDELEAIFRKGFDLQEAEEYYMSGGAPPQDFSSAIAASAEAIASIESGGDYNARGPVIPTGQYAGQQALGKYQVMAGNVGPWSQEALGYEISPDQFIANPQIQDAIFAYKFGQAAEKYGSLEDAASVWFSGRPLEKAGNASDVLGTTTPDYVKRFTRNLNNYNA